MDFSGYWVEKLLAGVLELATRWTGILLLDEADVSMQARSLESLDRNQIVSCKFPVNFLL